MIPLPLGRPSVSAPPGPRYQKRGVVPGTGKLEKPCWKPEYGLPGVNAPDGDLPAPLSNSTVTSGSFSNAASAAV